MITDRDRRVNRDGAYRIEERRGSNSKVKNIAVLVCGTVWKDRSKVELRDKRREGGHVCSVR